jgi:hypothetical protein
MAIAADGTGGAFLTGLAPASGFSRSCFAGHTDATGAPRWFLPYIAPSATAPRASMGTALLVSRNGLVAAGPANTLLVAPRGATSAWAFVAAYALP